MTPPAGARRLDVVLAVTALAFLAAVRAGVLDERDPYWQTRAGLENLDGAPLSRPDSWSWEPVDRLFTQTSPWWNDLLATGWRTAGFAGFFAVGFLSILAYGVVALVAARRLGGRPLPALAGLLATMLLALPFLSPRGALTAQTLFLAALVGLHAGAPRLAALRTPVAAVSLAAAGVVVAGLGIRLHLSWSVLAPALAVCGAVVLALAPGLGRRRAVTLAAAWAAGLAAGVVSGPYGTGVWALSRRVQDATTGVVIEWLPTWTPGLSPRWVPTALATAALAVLLGWWWLRRRSDPQAAGRIGLAAALLLVAVPAAVVGFATIRVVGLSLLTLAPLAGAATTVLVDRLRERSGRADHGVLAHERVRHWLTGGPWRVVVTAVLVVVAPLVVLAAAALGRPLTLAPAIEALPRDCRLVSDADSAGPVLLVRPDVQVWVDTRADYWGRERNASAIRLVADGVDDTGVLDRATCALVGGPGGSGLASLLDADPRWDRTFAEGVVTVWTRDSASS